MTRSRLALWLVPAVAVAAACSDSPTAPPLEQTPAPAGPAAVEDPLDLARRIPGFGGYFLDAQGRPTVYLSGPADPAIAASELGDELTRRGLGPSDLRVRPASYTWLELHEWHERSTMEALSVPGTFFTDIDEASNRLRVGVADAASASEVRATFARLGVPEAAVIVEVTEPILPMVTLRDQVRPVVGGLQINFGQYVCTLGFNAGHSAGNSFITNSHCTNTQGGTEGTLYYQPLSSVSGSFIGTEAADPTYFRGGACPRGRRCRYSDAARVSYVSGVTFTLGGLARTTGPNNGSLTIDGGYTIGSEYAGTSFTVGEIVNKVGRTTGWTQGQVTNTCVNTSVSGSQLTLLCQTFVAAGVGGGDSGSPVFTITGTSSARLNGILWGGNSSGTTFVFSPLAFVEQELGSLTTF